MTAEQHKAYTEACNAFGEALERIFGTTKNKEEERQKAREIIDKYKREGILKDNPKAPTMERQEIEEDDIYDAVRKLRDEKAKDWEILEFKDKDGIKYAHEGRDLYVNSYGLFRKALPELLTDQNYFICSVRRLSDNTVWTVGEWTNEGKITQFYIFKEQMRCHCTYGGYRVLNLLEKIIPLFTAADGEPVFEGDRVYILVREGANYTSEIHELKADKDPHHSVKEDIYSTREAAEKAYECWLLSQPVLTGYDAFKWQDGANLSDLIKDKIAKR